ncbi:MAG: LytR/AlgR family response regulator transcription factor [Lewinella sp.]
MRAIIVDDDPNMHEVLPAILKEVAADIEVVNNAMSLAAGVKVIKEDVPDLLFLDIDLGDGTGFDLLEQLDYGKYLIIFISGHSQYGRRALEFEALAYLDKPLRATELISSLERAARRYEFRNYEERIADLSIALENYHEQKLPSRLTIHNDTGYHFLPVGSIAYFKGGKGITTVVMMDGRRISRAKPLRHFAAQFADYPNFLKIHQNYLVDVCKIERLLPGSIVVLPDGKEVKISTESAQLLKKRIAEVCKN